MAGKKPNNVHDGHRNRVREKFSKSEFSGMAQHEILEMLLFHSVPRKNTNELAHDLINRFGSLANVFEASEEELLKVPGVSNVSATLIKMMIPLFKEYNKEKAESIKLNSGAQCGNYLVEYYMGCDREKVVLVCFDVNNRVICVEDICEGDACNVTVNLRKIIETVMKNTKTTHVVLSHNHPNGIALPSKDDVNATEEIKKTLGSLGIALVDHIIVADNDFVSMSSSPGFGKIFK